MKKLLLVLVAVMGLTFAANAQAIGLRFGGGSSYGAEISYQTAVGNNRAEFDLGVNLPNFNFFYLVGVYQWTGGINDWLGWYAGPGLKASFCVNHHFGVAVAGQAGLEANFAALPNFQFTLDVRPEFEFILPKECINSFGWAAAFGVRYKL